MLVFLILIYIIGVNASSETKYIDLLPEKEKQDFLQRIARRILEEVEPGVHKNVLPDITKDELDAHNDFIKKILNEEKANFRADAKDAKLNQTDLTVKPLIRKGKHKNAHIDLTLRSRNKRDGTSLNDGIDDEQSKNGKVSSVSEEKDIQVISKPLNDKLVESAKKDIKITKDVNSEVTEKDETEDFLENTEKSTQELKENQSFSQNNGSLNIEISNFTHNDSEIKITKDTQIETAQKILIEEQNHGTTQVIDVTSETDAIAQDKTTVIEKDSLIVNIRRSDGSANEEINEHTLNKPFTDEIYNLKSKQFVQKHILRSESSDIPIDSLPTENRETEDVKLAPLSVNKINVSDVSSTENIETIQKSLGLTTESPGVVTTILYEATVTESNANVIKDDETTKVPSFELIETTENYVPITNKVDKTKSSKKEIKKETHDYETASHTNDIKHEVSSTTDTVKKEIMAQRDDKDSPMKTIFIDLETLQQSKFNKMQNSNEKIISASIEHIEHLGESNSEKFDTLNRNIDLYGPQHLRATNYDSENYMSKSKTTNITNLEEVKSENNEVTTENNKVLTPLPLDVTKLVDSMELIEHKIKKKDNPHNDIIEEMKEAIIKDNKIDANGKFEGLKSVNKLIPHRVYEIPANQSPFVKEEEVNLNQEQPNVVPIYNYSPNNAFYNGINNQGPNPNDLGVHRLSDDPNYTKGADKFQIDYFLPNDDRNRNVKVVHFDSQDNNNGDNLNEILNGHFLSKSSEEPDIGRSCKNRDKKEVEDSGLKDKIRQARTFMYEKKYFGFPELKNYTSESQELFDLNIRSDDRRFPNFKNHFPEKDNNNIAMDYYFSNVNEPVNYRAKKIYDKQRDILGNLIARIAKINEQNYNHAPSQDLVIKKKQKKRNLRKKKKNTKKNDRVEPQQDVGNINTILDMTPEVDLMPTMNKLLQKNLGRKGIDERDVEIYIDVLSDMVQSNNRGLENYDWIGTTVDIQGAISKLISLTDLVLKKQYINPLDYELLKYIVYLHKQTVKTIKISKNNRKYVLPKEKGKKSIKEKWFKNRLWSNRGQVDLEAVIKKHDIYIFKQFLKELQNKLYELHSALTQIAGITTYKNQHWFKNLKELYLDTTKARTLELLLHLITTRVLDSIENSSTKGLEEDYIQYMDKNPKDFEKVKSDFVLMLVIMELMDKTVD